MKRRLARIREVAISEWFCAVRSRRALVVLVLYAAASFRSMQASVSLLGKLEDQLTTVLGLPATEERGVVSKALWQSSEFRKMLSKAVADPLVYEGLAGRHPVELIYAFFAFLYVPLLVVLVSGNRVSDDLSSGEVRYMLTRVTRLEWSLGKYAGQALMLLPAILIGGLAAWAVAALRLPAADVAGLLPPMFSWALRAWILSLAYLGAALGVSHFTRSGAKATVLGVILLAAFFVLPKLADYFSERPGLEWLPHLKLVFPSWAEGGLWRAQFAAVVPSAAWLLALGLAYLLVGAAHLNGKDAR